MSVILRIEQIHRRLLIFGKLTMDQSEKLCQRHAGVFARHEDVSSAAPAQQSSVQTVTVDCHGQKLTNTTSDPTREV